MTWDSLYELQPADTTVIADTDDVIRGLKAAIRERFAREHEFDLTDSANQGRHLMGTGRAWYQASAPTYRQPIADLVALGTDDAGQLWVDSDDKIMKVWDGDSFENLAVTKAAVTAVGTAGSFPLVYASSTGSGPKDLYVDATGEGGTYNPSTNLAVINISGNAATADDAANANIALYGRNCTQVGLVKAYVAGEDAPNGSYLRITNAGGNASIFSKSSGSSLPSTAGYSYIGLTFGTFSWLPPL